MERSSNDLTGLIVDAAFGVHHRLGPGLLESVYEAVLARALEKRGLVVERQKVIGFEFDGDRFEEGLRVDLLVQGTVVVELKSVERASPVHLKQVLTYLRLLNLPVGLLINFGTAYFRDGVRRVANTHPLKHQPTSPPALRHARKEET